jgi:hypothetical protein
MQIVYIPDSRILHRVSLERTRFRYFAKRCYSEGISKAHISALVGKSAATEDERNYVRTALPAGVRKGLISSLRGDVFGAVRAGTIVLGLGLTVFGYVRGALSRIGFRRGK